MRVCVAAVFVLHAHWADRAAGHTGARCRWRARCPRSIDQGHRLGDLQLVACQGAAQNAQGSACLQSCPWSQDPVAQHFGPHQTVAAGVETQAAQEACCAGQQSPHPHCYAALAVQQGGCQAAVRHASALTVPPVDAAAAAAGSAAVDHATCRAEQAAGRQHHSTALAVQTWEQGAWQQVVQAPEVVA